MFDRLKPPSPPQQSQEFFEQLETYYQKTIQYHIEQIAIAEEKLRAIAVLLDRDNSPSNPTNLTNQNKFEQAEGLGETAATPSSCPSQENGKSSNGNGSNSVSNAVKVTQTQQLSLLAPRDLQQSQFQPETSAVGLLERSLKTGEPSALKESNGVASQFNQYLVITSAPENIPISSHSAISLSRDPRVGCDTGTEIEVDSKINSNKSRIDRRLTEVAGESLEAEIEEISAFGELNEDNLTASPQAETEATRESTPLANREIEPLPEELSFESSADKITGIFRENSGTILEIEYLIRKLSGIGDRDLIEELKPKLRSILVRGQKEGLWAKVPDAPNCWTLDLTRLPESKLITGTEEQELNVHCKAERLLKAIKQTLKNAAPNPLSAKEIAQKLLPARVNLTQKNYFFKRVLVLLQNWGDKFAWKEVDGDNSQSSSLARGLRFFIWSGQNQENGSSAEKLTNNQLKDPASIAMSRENLQSSARADRTNSCLEANNRLEEDLKAISEIDRLQTDLAVEEQKSPTARVTSSERFKHLPSSPKLDRYLSLKEAIFACLKAKDPEIISTKDLIEWFYPEGLAQAIEKKVRKILSTTLANYDGYHWVKVKRGFYRFDPELAC